MNQFLQQINYTRLLILQYSQRLEDDPENETIQRCLRENLELLETMKEIVNERGIEVLV